MSAKHFLWISLAMAGCAGQQERPETTNNVPNTELLEYAEVTLCPVQEEIVLSGDIVADERRMSRVVLPIGGKLSDIGVEAGDRVARGARLATVISGEAADHQRELQKAESKVRLAERELAMKEELRKDGIASEKEVEAARERLAVARATRDRQLSLAELNGYNGKSSATITAPISGVILTKEVYNNQFAEAGSEAFTIADISKLWVVADVYETDISNIREGAAAMVETIAWPDETFEGHIDKIYGALDPESKTMKVRINLDNKQMHLRPGMFASVRVAKEGKHRQLPCVPSEAVVFENGHQYVIVRDNSGCRRQEVSVAHESHGQTFISKGIEAGQQIVSQNALLIFNQLGQ